MNIRGRQQEDAAPYAFARLYVILALPLILLINITFPNFHAPDDYDHVKRATTIITGQLRSTTVVGKSSGAFIDSGLSAYIDAAIPLVKTEQHPLSDQQAETYRDSSRIKWSGKLVFSEAPGSMAYLPILYIPQAAVLWIGQHLNATIAASVLAARLVNSLVGIALVWIGLRIIPTGHALILIVMLLPRTLLQFASNSADPTLDGIAIIFTALAIRTWNSEGVSVSVAAWTAPLMLATSAVRPSFIPLTFPLFVIGIQQRAWKAVLILSLPVILVIAWFVNTLPTITELRCGNIGSASDKITYFLVNWPFLISRSMIAHLPYYVASLVGDFGWGHGVGGHLGKRLPVFTYIMALVALGLGALHDAKALKAQPNSLRLVLLITSIAMAFIIFFALYSACTDPTLGMIDGVQGRYFVASIIMIAPALASLKGKPYQVRRLYVFSATAAWSVINVTVLCFGGYNIYHG